MRTADIDRGDLAGARDALNVSDDRAVASSGLDITIIPPNSDLEHPPTPDGAILEGPSIVARTALVRALHGRVLLRRQHADNVNTYKIHMLRP